MYMKEDKHINQLMATYLIETILCARGGWFGFTACMLKNRIYKQPMQTHFVLTHNRHKETTWTAMIQLCSTLLKPERMCAALNW